MKIKAYSKINLGLKIYPRKEPEKIHKIDSLFLLNKNIFDKISLKKNPTLSVKYFISSKEFEFSNCLVIKSLKYLQKKYSININYEILINKKIPIMSGLGGGSSDAAAVMKYLCKKNDIENLDLLEISNTLGSDIPFFLSGFKAARVMNFGDKITELKLPKIKYKVFDFNTPCSTKKIYDLFDKESTESTVDLDTVINKIRCKKLNDNIIINDLQAAVFKEYPKLKKIWDALKSQYEFVTVSGSGGTIVAIKERKKIW